MNGFDITEGLVASVWESLKKAIDNNSSETIQEFITFYRSVLQDSVRYKKTKYFKQFIYFPSAIYEHIAMRNRQNVIYQTLVREISEQLSVHIREIIGFYIAIIGKTYVTDDEKPLLNELYYHAFSSFNDLLYKQSRNQDWNLLRGSLKRYRLLDGGVFESSLRDELELQSLIKDKTISEERDEVKKLNASVQIARNYDRLKRQPILAIKYWLFLLFEQDILQSDVLNNLLVEINKINNYEPNKEIADVLFFRTADLKNYMGWEDWDYTERPEIEVYSPPMPSKWMTKGFVIDRIRTSNASFNKIFLTPELTSDIPFFYDAVVENIEQLRNSIDKWKNILLVRDIDDFNIRAYALLDSIALAKRGVIGHKERAIAASKLDNGKILAFKQKMGEVWKSQTRVRRLFNHFENIIDVTNETIKLKRVGQNIFFEKAKMMFISGENHSHIYGMDEIGGKVARWEDDLFIDVISTPDNVKVQDNTALEVITKCIELLRGRNTEPSAIFLEPEYLYKDEAFMASEMYSQQYDAALNPENINFFVLGTFDKIPLFSSHSFALKNKIIVSDFARAFQMLHKTNTNWYDNELSVSVLEINDDIAYDKYLKGGDKWKTTDEGVDLSEQDSLTLIKTSIIIDIETITDFKVSDTSKYLVGYVSNPLSD